MKDLTVATHRRDDDKWEVKWDNAKQASRVTETKDEAMDIARRIARNRWKHKSKPTQILVHKANGKIQRDHTIPRSEDPFPPRG